MAETIITIPEGSVTAPGLAFTSGILLGIYKNGSRSLAIAADSQPVATFSGKNLGVNYLDLQNAATGANPVIQAAGTDTNIGITLTAKGTGTISLSNPELVGAITVTSASANALAVGLAGTTNPALNVDASTATSATGLNVKSAAAAGGLAVAVISSGTNENLTIDAKGSGTITLGATSTGNVVVSRTLAASLGITSSGATAGIGYAAGAGGAVSQLTDRTTGVTINKITGTITTQATSLAAAALVSFTVTDSAVAIGDTVLVSIQSGPTTVGTIAYVTVVAAGSFQITLKNGHASTADTGAALINFAVIKAVSA